MSKITVFLYSLRYVHVVTYTRTGRPIIRCASVSTGRRWRSISIAVLPVHTWTEIPGLDNARAVQVWSGRRWCWWRSAKFLLQKPTQSLRSSSSTCSVVYLSLPLCPSLSLSVCLYVCTDHCDGGGQHWQHDCQHERHAFTLSTLSRRHQNVPRVPKSTTSVQYKKNNQCFHLFVLWVCS